MVRVPFFVIRFGEIFFVIRFVISFFGEIKENIQRDSYEIESKENLEYQSTIQKIRR
jgi:hypothetical protein